MKNLYLLFSIFGFLSLTSCVVDNEEYFEEPTPDYGEIQLNNTSFPIYFADIYYLNSDTSGGRIYEVTLTDNFSASGIRNANVALYLNIFRPVNAPLDGTYYLGNASGNSVDYIQYYRDVTFNNGKVKTFSSYKPDASFNNGYIKIRYISTNYYFIEYQFTTIFGDVIIGDYTGYVSN